jgi:hypothetical protein
MWCPVCADEFRTGFDTCPDCGAALVAERPPARDPGPYGDPITVSDLGREGELLEYDLSDWDGGRRDALRAALAGSAIPCVWERDDRVVVNRLWETEVDGLVDMVDPDPEPDPGPDLHGDPEPDPDLRARRIDGVTPPGWHTAGVRTAVPALGVLALPLGAPGALAATLWLLAVYLPILGPRRQGLHDRAARTEVVRDRR